MARPSKILPLDRFAASIREAFGAEILAEMRGSRLRLKAGPKAAWFDDAGRLVGESFDGIGSLEVCVDEDGVVIAPAGATVVA